MTGEFVTLGPGETRLPTRGELRTVVDGDGDAAA